jgi:hypothetical protein
MVVNRFHETGGHNRMPNVNNMMDTLRFFAVISVELILIFVVVSFFIGLLMEYLPPNRIRDFLSNRLAWMQYVLGALLGAATPFCSCSTVPITAGLLRSGVPFGPTMAFLFSSPVLNPVIIALLLSLFGYRTTLIYAAVTFFGAMAAAVILSKLGMETQVKPLVNLQEGCCSKNPSTAPSSQLQTASLCCITERSESPILPAFPSAPIAGGCCAASDKQGNEFSFVGAASPNGESTMNATPVPFAERLKRAFHSAVDTFKGVFWYLMLGAAIGAFIYGFFPQDLVVRLAGPDNPWSIPVAALVGVPMYIRAETIIPISAALVGKGMGVGTVLALIVGGAGASIPEMIILGSMFRAKLIVAFVLNVFLVAVAGGYLVNALIY